MTEQFHLRYNLNTTEVLLEAYIFIRNNSHPRSLVFMFSGWIRLSSSYMVNSTVQKQVSSVSTLRGTIETTYDVVE